MCWDSRSISVAQIMAEIIRKHVEPEKVNCEDMELKSVGIAYEEHTL